MVIKLAFFNVGEFYGPNFINLNYVKDFFKKYPDLRKNTIISCKGAYSTVTYKPLLKTDEVIKSVRDCVEQIGGYIDIFEPARLDPEAADESEVYAHEPFDALAALVEEGAIGGISLSEVTAEEIVAIHKDYGKYLVCVEVELSMFTKDILNNGIAKACNDLNLVVICYSPLGKGLLTGTIKKNEDIEAGDVKKGLKIFHGDALKQNLLLVKFLEEEILAKRDPAHPITLPQIALGWIKHWNRQPEFSGARFIPIPSGSTLEKINQNFEEDKCRITEAEFEKIENYLDDFKVVGGRYEFIGH